MHSLLDSVENVTTLLIKHLVFYTRHLHANAVLRSGTNLLFLKKNEGKLKGILYSKTALILGLRTS